MKLIDIKAAAEMIGVKPATVRDWIQQRRIGFLKVNGSIRFDVRKLEAWLESKAVTPDKIWR